MRLCPFFTFPFWLSLLPGAFCLFYGLGSYGFLDNNEGLYGEIPREMLLSGNYIIPHLNGVPYLEKPPLLYWLISASYMLFGQNEWAARLIPASSGLLTIIMTSMAARRFFSPQVSALATLFMGTGMGYAVFCRMVFFDILFTFLISAALLSWFLWQLEKNRMWLRLCYGAVGFAILAKGFVSIVLFSMVVICHNLLSRRKLRDWLGDGDAAGIFLFLIITFPWHYMAFNMDPGFGWFYFINEHIFRFMGMREPHDYYHGPIYYYIHRIFLYFLPWSLLIPFFYGKTDQKENNKEKSIIFRFLMVWFWAFFIFFSLSRAKANYYIIVALPPLSLLLAEKVVRLDKIMPYIRQFFAALWGSILLVLSFMLFLWKTEIAIIQFPINPTPLSWYVPFIPAILSGCMFLVSIRLKEWIYHLTSWTCVIIMIVTVHQAAHFEEDFSSRFVVRHFGLEQRDVCLFRDFEKISGFTFYIGHPLPIIESQSNDLLYGQRTGIHSNLFPSLGDLGEKEKPSCPYVISTVNHARDFEQLTSRYELLKVTKKIRLYKLVQKEAPLKFSGKTQTNSATDPLK